MRTAVLNLHHLPETITRQVGDGADFGLQVRYSWEGEVLGSAGGPRKALDLLPPHSFVIVNGDTLSGVDFAALAAAHRQGGALVTLAVVKNRWAGRYGGVVTDAAGRVAGFVPRNSPAASYHFIGVQMTDPSVFSGLPINVPAESVGDLYPRLIAADRGNVRAWLCDVPFWDVGTPEDYLDTALAIGRSVGLPGVQIGERAAIHPTAAITESVIWDDVRVGAGAVLRRCVVADGVMIPDGARFEDSAIVERGGRIVSAWLGHHG